MSLTALTLAAGAVLVAGGFVAACTANSTTNGSGSTGDDDAATSNTDSSTTDAGTATTDAAADAADADSAVPQAFVRLANWSPDATAIDVCFDPPGAAWTGVMPALGQITSTFDGGTTVPDAGDGGSDGGTGAPGLNFPQVTTYLVIPAGTYAVRLVPAGATDCTEDVVDLPNMAVLAANTYTTIAALGEVNQVGTDSKLELVSFNDDATAPSSEIALRFINGSPSSSLTQVDLGTGSLVGSGGTFAPLFTGVAFGAAGTAAATDAGAVDVNGYLAEAPLAGATLSVHATAGAQDTTTALNDVTIASGAATAALIGGISNGIAADAAQLLVCTDVDDSTSASLYATCKLVSTQ